MCTDAQNYMCIPHFYCTYRCVLEPLSWIAPFSLHLPRCDTTLPPIPKPLSPPLRASTSILSSPSPDGAEARAAACRRQACGEGRARANPPAPQRGDSGARGRTRLVWAFPSPLCNGISNIVALPVSNCWVRLAGHKGGCGRFALVRAEPVERASACRRWCCCLRARWRCAEAY